MYDITREKCPHRERTWILKINDIQFGVVEVIHMTDTLRSIVGTFAAFTKDFSEQIIVSYDCEKVKHRISYSINNFIDDIHAEIGDREIHVPRVLEDDAPEQLYVHDDITEDTVDTAINMMRLDISLSLKGYQKVSLVQAHLKSERELNAACPMRDLVQKAKLARTRATPVHVHAEW